MVLLAVNVYIILHICPMIVLIRRVGADRVTLIVPLQSLGKGRYGDDRVEYVTRVQVSRQRWWWWCCYNFYKPQRDDDHVIIFPQFFRQLAHNANELFIVKSEKTQRITSVDFSGN